jgi:amino-acid N-acetyltransferase
MMITRSKATIEAARPADVDAVLCLLEHHHLPLDGLRDHIGTTRVARQDGRVVGCAALEIYADGALLRSVAVSPEWQGRRLGHDVTEATIHLAEDLHVPVLYLLTTTADHFPKFGFERIDRADVPSTVQTSIEFTSGCRSSAVVMRKRP